MKRVVAFGVVVASLALVAAAGGEVHRADCERGPVMMGSGPPDWKQRSIAAGPLGVFRNPLGRMSETGNGQLTAKMPAIVEGSSPVTLSVPLRLRHRVFLYYGRFPDPIGKQTTTINRSPGFSEVRFEPCTNRPRTPFPGGIRIKGRKPVRLTVTVEGQPEGIPLPLGRPVPFRR